MALRSRVDAEIMLTCDLIVAAKGAKIGIREVNGLSLPRVACLDFLRGSVMRKPWKWH